MLDHVHIAIILIALFVPWLVGTLLVGRVLSGSCAWNAYLIAGYGYFAGVFIVTLIMRLFDTLQLPITFHTVLIGTAACSLPAFWRLPVPDATSLIPTREKLGNWSRIAMGLLLALVALRYYTLAAEVTLRPIYSWDAWMNWAPKAIVWLHHGEMVPFVTPEQWLSNETQTVYTLGNAAASTYPHTVPLLIWWMMMAADTSSSGVIMMPWVLAPLALCSAMYGHLRISGVTPLLGMIAVYVLANMPYVNVHSALAGYADIWLTAAFSLALLSAAARAQTGELRWTLMCLFCCLLCVTLKRPGLIFAGIAFLALATATFTLSRKLIMCMTAATGIFLLLVFFVGISADIPGIGKFRLDRHGVLIPLLGRSNFVLLAQPGSAATALLGMINWNLLFYFVIVLTLTRAFIPKRLAGANVPILTGVILATACLTFIFTFTHYSTNLQNFVSFNRTVLYLTPALTYLLINSAQVCLNIRGTLPP